MHMRSCLKNSKTRRLCILGLLFFLALSGCKKSPNGEIPIKDGRLSFEDARITPESLLSVSIAIGMQEKRFSDAETIRDILDQLSQIEFSEMKLETNAEGWATEAPGSRHVMITLNGKSFVSKITLPLHGEGGKLYLAPGDSTEPFIGYLDS